MIFCVFLLCSVDTHWNAQVHCRLIMVIQHHTWTRLFSIPLSTSAQLYMGKTWETCAQRPKLQALQYCMELYGAFANTKVHIEPPYLLHIVRALLKCVRMYAKWLRAFQLARLKVLHSLKRVAKVLGKLGSCVVLCSCHWRSALSASARNV